MRGNGVACCIWGALLLALILGFLFWPMLHDRVEREVDYHRHLDDPGG